MADQAVLVDEGDSVGQHLKQMVPGKRRTLDVLHDEIPLIGDLHEMKYRHIRRQT